VSVSVVVDVVDEAVDVAVGVREPETASTAEDERVRVKSRCCAGQTVLRGWRQT